MYIIKHIPKMKLEKAEINQYCNLSSHISMNHLVHLLRCAHPSLENLLCRTQKSARKREGGRESHHSQNNAMHFPKVWPAGMIHWPINLGSLEKPKCTTFHSFDVLLY